MSGPLEQACARVVQVDRGILADLNVVLTDLCAGATRREVEELLRLVIARGANRTTIAHAQLWQALHPEQPGVVPPALPLSAWQAEGAPAASPQPSLAGSCVTDCRSPDGVTVGLLDALITIGRVLAQRDLSSPAVVEALRDLAGDDDLHRVLHAAQSCAAEMCAPSTTR